VTVRKINLTEKLGMFQDHWRPHVVGALNGQEVKLVKLLGEFVWHHHEDADELFLVVHGSFRMDYRDDSGDQQHMDVAEGEFVIVPRGVKHRPVAGVEAHVLLFEPAGTRNTGNVRDVFTVEEPPSI
jgi:mannose-6-phosphate isomerase-like protein (cupin superfamily)